MPRNRRHRPHAEKADQLVTIATRLFLEKGYGGTTVAQIAHEAGIASNVVHWYFATKDHLFVAALDAHQARTLATLETRHLAHAEQDEARMELEAGLTELICNRVSMYELIATLHERSHFSPVVADFHERAHRRYTEYLGRAVSRCGTPTAERKLVVDTLVLALEGLIMHRASRPKVKRTVSFLVQRLIAS